MVGFSSYFQINILLSLKEMTKRHVKRYISCGVFWTGTGKLTEAAIR